MKLLNIFKYPQDKLKVALYNHLNSIGYKPVNRDGFVYAKGEIPVLLVAHMDTVHKTAPTIICKSEEGVLMSPMGIGGDDRCGIAMILEIIKTHKCHVLFTEDEERGGIGAGKFVDSEIKPEVNFLIEFDRAHEKDAVFYYCENDEFTDMVLRYGFDLDFGTYTDICDIAPELGVAAVNLSCGYYNAHTTHEYVILSHMWAQVERAKKLIENEYQTQYKYMERKSVAKTYPTHGYYNQSIYGGWYDDYFDDYPEEKIGKNSGKKSKTDLELVKMDFDEVVVSELPCDAYLKFYDDEEPWEVIDLDMCCIDEQGVVYCFDYDLGCFTPLHSAQAIGASGMPCRFNKEEAFSIEVAA